MPLYLKNRFFASMLMKLLVHYLTIITVITTFDIKLLNNSNS